MTVWPVADLMEFARTLLEAPDCLVKRRVMERMDDESMTICEATAILRDLVERCERGEPGYHPGA